MSKDKALRLALEALKDFSVTDKQASEASAAIKLALMNLFASFDPQWMYQNRNMSSNSTPSDIKPPWQDNVPFDAWLIQKK